MRDQYDFSSGERGKFYRTEASSHVPVYLDEEVREYLVKQAQSKGVELNQMVNDLLRKDISLVEAVK